MSLITDFLKTHAANLETMNNKLKSRLVLTYIKLVSSLPIILDNIKKLLELNKSTKNGIDRSAILDYLNSDPPFHNLNFQEYITSDELLLFAGNFEKAKNYFYLKMIVTVIKMRMTKSSFLFTDAKDMMKLIRYHRNSKDWFIPPFFGKNELTSDIDNLINQITALDKLYEEIEKNSLEKIFSENSAQYLKDQATQVFADFKKTNSFLETSSMANLPVPNEKTAKTYSEISFLKISMKGLKEIYKFYCSEHGAPIKEYRSKVLPHEMRNDEDWQLFYKEGTIIVGHQNYSEEIKKKETQIDELQTKMNLLLPKNMQNMKYEEFLNYWQPYFDHPNYQDHEKINATLTDQQREVLNLFYDKNYPEVIEKLKSTDDIQIMGNLSSMANKIILTYENKFESIFPNNKKPNTHAAMWKNPTNTETNSEPEETKMEEEEPNSDLQYT